MDSAQGAGPAAADAGGDWRPSLRPESRSRIVKRIMETLEKHLPVTVPYCEGELQNIAVRFEEKIFNVATSQSDYLRKISLKLLSMESRGPTNTQQNLQNAQVVQDQRPLSLASNGSTSHTVYPAAGHVKEELYQMINGKTSGAGGDWRILLQPEARSRIVNKIMETLKKHLPVTVPEGLSELQKIAERFEERIYNGATNQSDYLRKISLKMLSMESSTRTNTPQSPLNAQVVQNQRLCSLASGGSTSHSGYPGALNELYQMNKTLNEQYLEGLSDLYELSMKLHVDNHMAPQKPTNQNEEMKSFKSLLERSLHSLQINKSCVQPSFEESTPTYKRQIISILNSEEWTPEKKFQQSAGQAPSISSSRTQKGMLSPEQSNVKRLRGPMNDDIHS